MKKSWILNEDNFAESEHFDQDYVEAYEEKAQYNPAKDISALIDQGLNEKSTVVDLGAGTGIFSFGIAPFCHKVFAVDPSPAMCEFMGHRKIKDKAQNVTVSQSGFLTFDVREKSIEFVFTRNALHQTPDFWKVQAFERIYTMLSDNGIFSVLDIIYDFDHDETETKIEEWIKNAATIPEKGYTKLEFANHVREEHSTFSWIFELMLQRTGFHIVSKQFRKSVYGACLCSKNET
jgi:SAM-dependent methyltransferase